MNETTTPKRGGFTPEMRAKAAATRAAKKAAAIVKPSQRPAAERSEFSGMTAVACCDDCNEGHCVVSGIGVCAHPRKGGLQAAQKGNSKALSRFERAKEYLA